MLVVARRTVGHGDATPIRSTGEDVPSVVEVR
jgi:hypothetical protein